MNFLLLHGGFHGGWCWRDVAANLRGSGHTVFAPSFTGSGERSHLLTNETGLYSGIEDTLNVIESEELSSVTIVGHSLAGGPMAGVADILGPGRISRLIYLDAILLQDGQCVLDAMPPEVAEERRRMAQQNSNNSLTPTPASSFGLTDPDQVAWVERRLTPQAFGSFTERLSLLNPEGNRIPQTYISCINPSYKSVAHSAAWARAQDDWTFLEFNACHNAMIERPRELANLLNAIVSEDAGIR